MSAQVESNGVPAFQEAIGEILELDPAADGGAPSAGSLEFYGSDGAGVFRYHAVQQSGTSLLLSAGTGASKAAAKAAATPRMAFNTGTFDLYEDPTAGIQNILRHQLAVLGGDRLVTWGDEDYVMATIKAQAAAALLDSDFANSPNPGVLERTGAGAYQALRLNTAASSPNNTHNTAAGYPNWSRWRDTQSGSEWIKVGESGGNAQWEKTGGRVGQATLNDNQAAPANVGSGLSWPLAVYYAVEIRFAIKRGTANSRQGTLRLALEDNTDTTALGETSTEVGATGVTLSLAVAAGVVTLQYTSMATGTAPRLDFETRNYFL